MDKLEAIEKAQNKWSKYGSERVVIERTDHPRWPGFPVYMVAKANEIRQLSPGSTIIFRVGSDV